MKLFGDGLWANGSDEQTKRIAEADRKEREEMNMGSSESEFDGGEVDDSGVEALGEGELSEEEAETEEFDTEVTADDIAEAFSFFWEGLGKSIQDQYGSEMVSYFLRLLDDDDSRGSVSLILQNEIEDFSAIIFLQGGEG